MKTGSRLSSFLLAGGFSLAAFQFATAQIVTNGDLENIGGTFNNNGQGVMVLAPGSTAIPGWTVTHDSVVWAVNGNVFGPTTSFGSFFIDLTGFHDNGSFGGITQTISTTAGQNYTFSLSLGADPSFAPYGGAKSVAVSAGSSSAAFTFTPVGLGSQWGNFAFDFVAQSSSTLLTIQGTADAGGQDLGLDHIAVTLAERQPGAVPEPSTYGVMGTLALGCIALLRRQRISRRLFRAVQRLGPTCLSAYLR